MSLPDNAAMQSELRRSALILASLAAVVNAVILFVVIPHFAARLHLFYNQDVYADGYDEIASTIAKGGGYRFFPDTAQTVMREPGYPMLLAGIFRTFGANFEIVKFTNYLLALATAWLLVKIAREVSSDQAVISIAPLLFLFHPGVLVAESRGGVEILFAFCLTLFVFALYCAVESGTTLDYLLAGGALGLAVLVKSTPLLFPIAVFVYLFSLRPKKIWAVCGRVALIIAAMFAVLSPWIVRNYEVTGGFVPTASVLGISAHAGQYVCENLSGNNFRKDVDREAAAERRTLAIENGYAFRDMPGAYYQYFYSTSDEMKFSSFLMRRVLAEYERSPLLLPKCAGSNLLDFWFAGKTWLSTELNVMIQIPYLLLAICGVWLSWKKGSFRLFVPLILLIVYTMAISAPILAQARYSVPIIPFVSILAGLSIAAIFGRARRAPDKLATG